MTAACFFAVASVAITLGFVIGVRFTMIAFAGLEAKGIMSWNEEKARAWMNRS